jgi:hypothetical protein
MEEELIGAAEKQFECLEKVCTKELGEVIDMIKDLEEAKYYYTVTGAMEEGSWKTEKGDHLHEEDSRHKGRSARYLEAKEMNKDKAT